MFIHQYIDGLWEQLFTDNSTTKKKQCDNPPSQCSVSALHRSTARHCVLQVVMKFSACLDLVFILLGRETGINRMVMHSALEKHV